jgi:hypothetical protein
MNLRLKTIVIVLAALLALAVAGCGGGGGTESTATATSEEPAALSKADLISQGDAICAEVNAAVGALGGGESEVEAVVGEEGEKVANLYAGMVKSLKNLGAPAEDEGEYAEFESAAAELERAEGEVKLAAEREDVAGLEEAESKAETALEEFQSQATAFGFEDCGEGPKAPTVTPGGGGTGGTEGGEEFEGVPEEGGVEVEPELEEPEYAEPEYVEPEEAPETGGAGGGEVAPEPAPEGGGSESGGVGPG